jgi:hypothetical protein
VPRKLFTFFVNARATVYQFFISGGRSVTFKYHRNAVLIKIEKTKLQLKLLLDWYEGPVFSA